MRVITWNINSVRLRLGLVKKLTGEAAPDILCLQETKCQDQYFPVDDLRAMGYAHQHFHGMKSYNGVAILAKHPLTARAVYHRAGREDCRHIAAQAGGIELHNLYIPAGGDEPDPAINDKYAHKLAFIDEMTRWFKGRYRARDRLVAVGDFNIAPYEHDVWSHRQLLKVVSHTPAETQRLAQMRKSLDWIDVARHFVPADEKCYTWWSYRNRDWKRSNRGRRLDHIWVTPPLKAGLQRFEVLSQTRDWQKPSDHAPVAVDLAP